MKLTKKQQEFIGTEFPTPTGATLRVESFYGTDRRGVAMFNTSCSVCEGLFIVYKENLIKGKVPCSCREKSKIGKLTRFQEKFIGTKFPTPVGGCLTVTGVSPIKAGSNAQFTLTCNKCNGSFVSTKANLEKGAIPCGCRKTYFEDKLSKDVEDFIGSTFEINQGIFLSVHSYAGRRGETKIILYNLTCSKCSLDEELFPTGSIISSKGDLWTGRLPCGCSKSPKWSQEQYRVLVNRECTLRGFKFCGWHGTFKGSATLLKLYNPRTEMSWCSATISNFLRGTGDPSLGGGGYDPEKRGTLYLVHWFDTFNSYIKKGITNLTTLKRAKDQSSKSPLQYKILSEVVHENGRIADNFESYLNSKYKGSECPKELLPDGYTETVLNTPETLARINEDFDKLELALECPDTTKAIAEGTIDYDQW